MEVQANARIRGLNTVVEGIDRTLDEGRELDVLFDSMIRHRQAARQAMGFAADADDDLSAEALTTADDQDSGVQAVDSSEESATKKAPPMLTELQWLDVLQQARNRGLGECAICMSANKGLRSICMLSCSHIFHSQCMANFEKFMSGSEHRGCPICRANFTSKSIATGGMEWGLTS